MTSIREKHRAYATAQEAAALAAIDSDLATDAELGAGGQDPWTDALSLPLTSLTNWTADGGTWVAQTDRIDQTDAAGPTRRLVHTKQDLDDDYDVSCEVRATTAANGRRVGLVIGTTDGSASAGFPVYLESNGSSMTSLRLENDGVELLANQAASVAFNTWVDLLVQVRRRDLIVWLDGTRRFGVRDVLGVDSGVYRNRFGLYSWCDSSFRNLLVTRPTRSSSFSPR